VIYLQLKTKKKCLKNKKSDFQDQNWRSRIFHSWKWTVNGPRSTDMAEQYYYLHVHGAQTPIRL